MDSYLPCYTARYITCMSNLSKLNARKIAANTYWLLIDEAESIIMLSLLSYFNLSYIREFEPLGRQ